MNLTNINTTISPELKRKLEEDAEQHGENRSQALRRILGEYFSRRVKYVKVPADTRIIHIEIQASKPFIGLDAKDLEHAMIGVSVPKLGEEDVS